MRRYICILIAAAMMLTACNKISISNTISKESYEDKLAARIASIHEYAQKSGLEYESGWKDICKGDYIIEGGDYITLTNTDTKTQMVLSLYGDKIELVEIARECYSHSEHYDTTKGYICIMPKDLKKDCIRCELKCLRDGVVDSYAFGCDETFSEESVENVSNPFRDDGDGHYNMITRSWMPQEELKAMYDEGLEFAYRCNELF